MSFDEMYDEMLHEEFSPRGRHQAVAASEPELTESASRGRHAAAEEPAAEAAERPRGFQRYRTATLVGAGGMACAAAGAFLGGLGGFFTISPAAAHPVAAPTITQDLPLAQAASHGSHSSSAAKGTSAVMAASFGKASGSLTKGVAPFATLTSLPLGNLPVGSLPGLGGNGGGGGNGTVGGGTPPGGTVPTTPPPGCSSGSLDLSCMVTNLTSVLGNLGAVPGSNPGNLLPSLDGVLTNLSTLQGLIASLPIPSGGAPTSVLAGNGGGAPVSTGIPATSGGTPSAPVVSALVPVLDTVTGALASTGGGPSPSLPLPVPAVPSVPGVTPSGTVAPTTVAPAASTPSNGSTTVNVPVPVPVPLPVPTVTVGGQSVGVSTSGSTSGLTLNLP